MEKFITIKENVQIEIVEKKSKFIANFFYVESAQQVENIIKQTKKKYFDARHNCIAYRIIENGQLIEKFSDDGEPSGTAGAPMLNILQKNELVNVLIIVTRYFGGILLGTGGLVRAYSSSLINAIENSEKVLKCIGEELEVTLDYNNFENFKYYCKNNEINIIDVRYTENIVCRIEIEQLKKQKLVSDFETKKIILKDIKDISIKFVTKSI
ncbi:MAG: YigZ family protein [Clostridia bacterium]|nr:YigZ family protein [Clostridia bacterium]